MIFVAKLIIITLASKHFKHKVNKLKILYFLDVDYVFTIVLYLDYHKNL